MDKIQRKDFVVAKVGEVGVKGERGEVVAFPNDAGHPWNEDEDVLVKFSNNLLWIPRAWLEKKDGE